MTPGTPVLPSIITNPTEPHPTMPVDGEDAVVVVTNEVDTDDMFDPMGS